MKFFTGDATFTFTWDQVVAAFWQRYPNPQSKHVLSEDVIERQVVGNLLITKRLISKTNSLPKWGERFVHGLQRHVYVVEESVVDLKNKTFVTYTRNIGLQKIMSIDEKCIYTQHPENAETTLCTRQAWVNSGVYGFSSVISSFGIQRFRKNAAKAVSGFEFVLNKLFVPETNSDSKVAAGSIKDKAKEYAKSKADTVKSKVPRPRMTSCQNNSSEL
ncbi:PRELI domain-containing protein 1, mitochondrial-like [Mercenaria mercenaria]|uniref:PRELI domain-containing protein 1, mitochondrial-like n=1 Tax=Mercenaria mercenaria TaxID=6596 RepID=UPI00234FAD2C|nr:PRELI domain-containing protein 1, mitochondrial-like [Mercenaria mercenaria]XP_045189415.2 PRELI domain-containing protein 1, mitochondrial-like [Mercenaria mercenaria]XP_045189416.2 PRELI domain-containing protein 1, mitochondrial-like [Mercenaria mercenaria]